MHFFAESCYPWFVALFYFLSWDCEQGTSFLLSPHTDYFTHQKLFVRISSFLNHIPTTVFDLFRSPSQQTQSRRPRSRSWLAGTFSTTEKADDASLLKVFWQIFVVPDSENVQSNIFSCLVSSEQWLQNRKIYHHKWKPDIHIFEILEFIWFVAPGELCDRR